MNRPTDRDMSMLFLCLESPSNLTWKKLHTFISFCIKQQFVPGVGCTVNSIMDMNNIESTHGSVYDTAGLHRSKDPGSSAFAPYHSAVTDVAEKESIPAGAELFATYGDYWIPDIPGAQVTLEEPLNRAEEFLQETYIPRLLGDVHNHWSQELKQGLWEFITQDLAFLSSQAMSNLPRASWNDVEEVFRQHKTKDDDFSLVRHFIRNQSIRNLEWLDEFGYCQDHLKPGISSLPQAGRGAFCNRDLPAGTVVGYSPLVHIGHYGKEIFTIEYPNKENNEKRRRQYDLILNYSFGHANSTVLLTPYGAMVNYINHSKEKANVKIRWPDKELVAHKPYWLEKTPEQLRDTIEKIGLSLEYVALRDLSEGEEVYMDYGDEWEAAWQEYLQKWTPPPGADAYIHSSQWKEKHFRTHAERFTNPYPPNLITMCYESFTLNPDGSYTWLPVLRPLNFRVYCDVLERQEGSNGSAPTYTVRMHLEGGESVEVRKVQEDGIFLYDKAFSQDWHLPNAFRHEIMIPDDVMPKAWLNGPPEEVLPQK